MNSNSQRITQEYKPQAETTGFFFKNMDSALETERIEDIALENAFAYFYMLNVQSQEIMFMSKSVRNVLGFASGIVKEKGQAFLERCIHDSDIKKMAQVREKIADYFFATPLHQRKQLKFEFNIRMSRSDGHILHLLHQVSFLETSETGEPLVTYHTVTDISRYKQDNTIRLTIYGMQNQCHKKLFEQDLFESNSLTKRQQEIIKLISEGLTSVEIGKNLGISMETVKNHRKKILQGMQAKNMMEAIRMTGNYHK